MKWFKNRPDSDTGIRTVGELIEVPAILAVKRRFDLVGYGESVNAPV